MAERTCVGCRRKDAPEAFFRVVAGPGGEVVAELESRLPGRGAHCCFTPDCVRALLRPRVLDRALRKKVQPPEEAELLGRLEALLRDRMKGLLAAAWRKGDLAAGRDAALRAARAGGPGRLFLAEDLSPASRREVAGAHGGPTELPLPMEVVGDILRRPPVGVVFVDDAGLAEALALRASQAGAIRTA